MSEKARITFSVEPRVKEHLKALAEKSGMSLSEWIRRNLLAASAAQLVTEQAHQGVPPMAQYSPDVTTGLPGTPPAFQVPFGPVPALERPRRVEAGEEPLPAPPGPVVPPPAPPPAPTEADEAGPPEPPVWVLLPDSNPGSYWLHYVEVGETLESIAARYYGNHQQYRRIARANNIYDPYVIYRGQPLVVPKPELPDHMLSAFTTGYQPWLTHRVQPGESLSDIAAHYYGNRGEYWRIALCNNVFPPSYCINANDVLDIPARVD
jgi:nucleoid-associated protein YgaU